MNTKISGFGGDIYLKKEIFRLIKKHKVRTVIETGTYLGDTTMELSRLVKKVYTIEINSQFSALAKLRCKSQTNIIYLIGNSPDIFRRILPNIKKPILFFLDAHWFDYWPIRDEIKAILKHSGSANIIVIHDFYVPGKNFGYDSYIQTKKNDIASIIICMTDKILRILFPKLTEIIFHKQKLDLEYIKDLIRLINPDFKFHYNSEATGKRRGVVYIEW